MCAFNVRLSSMEPIHNYEDEVDFRILLQNAASFGDAGRISSCHTVPCSLSAAQKIFDEGDLNHMPV